MKHATSGTDDKSERALAIGLKLGAIWLLIKETTAGATKQSTNKYDTESK
jgi:hypothetical protein